MKKIDRIIKRAEEHGLSFYEHMMFEDAALQLLDRIDLLNSILKDLKPIVQRERGHGCSYSWCAYCGEMETYPHKDCWWRTCQHASSMVY